MEKSEGSGLVILLKSNYSVCVENAVEALGGSEVLYEKLIKQIIRMLPSRIESMDGFLGEGRDLPAFGICVHGIKGLLSQVGCQGLALTAGRLETAAKTGDWLYCDAHYGAYRDELLRFCEKVIAHLPDVDKAETEAGSIQDYYDILCQARDAAEDYDSISAAEIVSRLTGICFGREIDTLVSEVVQALELFQPEKALNDMNELIKKCETPAGEKRGE